MLSLHRSRLLFVTYRWKKNFSLHYRKTWSNSKDAAISLDFSPLPSTAFLLSLWSCISNLDCHWLLSSSCLSREHCTVCTNTSVNKIRTMPSRQQRHMYIKENQLFVLMIVFFLSRLICIFFLKKSFSWYCMINSSVEKFTAFCSSVVSACLSVWISSKLTIR